jgi:hypothetical protein
MREPESAKALSEFKVACDYWLPKLNERGKAKALNRCKGSNESIQLPLPACR